MILEEIVAILGIRLEGEQNVRRFREGMASAGRAVDDFAKRAGQMAAVAGAAFATMAGGLAKSVIEQGMATQDLAAVLETVEGSAEGAQRSLAWVQEFAKQTPFDLMAVSQAFVRMRANGLNPMDGSFKAVGNAASAMGFQLMDGVEAIADATRAEHERLKAFGIQASVAGNQITYAWQENGETMRRTVEKDGAAITKALTEIFERRFSGAMERQSKTLRGIFTNLGDMWIEWKQTVADSGWFAYVEGRVSALRDWLKGLEADGTLARWAKMTSDAFVAVARQVEDSLGRLARLGRDIAEWANLESAGTPFIAFLSAIMWRAFPVAFALGAIVLALEDIQAYREGAESTFGRLADALGQLLNVGESVAEVLAGIVAGVAGLALLKPASALALAFAALTTPAGWAVILAGIGVALLVAFREEIMALPWFQEGVRIGAAIRDGFINGLGNLQASVRAAIGLPEGGIRIPFVSDALDSLDQNVSGMSGAAPAALGAAAPLSAAPSAGLAAGASAGGMVNSGNTQTNSFTFHQTFSGQQSTADQVRSGTRAGALDALRALGSTANPHTP
ncbi:MAG: tape measure protein [Salinarimonas sp.]